MVRALSERRCLDAAGSAETSEREEDDSTSLEGCGCPVVTQRGISGSPGRWLPFCACQDTWI